jgi:serine/threonine-protein kinase
MPDLLDRLISALPPRYRVIEVAGQGGMATVFRAEDRQFGRFVALKVFEPELASASSERRFLHEIQVSARLQHPRIIPVYDSGSAGDLLYYVMPFVEGESLGARVDREGSLPVPECLAVASQVGEALSFAHSSGVVHRDLKPDNVMLGPAGAVVTDFGVARALELVGDPGLTRTGVSIGTPIYMSPEQASGSKNVDARSDQYSLACLVYEMLVGEPPFYGKTVQIVMAKHLREPPPTTKTLRVGVPNHIDQAIRRALSKVPADRFPSVDAFVTALHTPSGKRWKEAQAADRSQRVGNRLTPKSVLVPMGLAAAAVLGTWLVMQPADIPLDPNKVVVYPLATDTDVSGADVSFMLQAGLEHADPLRALDGWAYLAGDDEPEGSTVGAEQARQVALAEGAGLYLLGRVVTTRDSVHVGLRLHDVRGDSLLASETRGQPRSPEAHLRAGLDALVALLPLWLDPGRTVDLSPLTERSPAAVALFIQGEREYRSARFREALDLYGQAVATDSLLAIAAVKGGWAAHWLDRLEDAQELVMRANAAMNLLPERYRRFATAQQHFLEGDGERAAAELRPVLVDEPDWAEAWMTYGEVHRHLFPQGASLDSAESAFRASTAADPSFTPPLYHLAEGAVLQGRHDEVPGLLEAYAAADPDSQNLAILDLIATCAAEGSSAELWASRASLGTDGLLEAAKTLSTGATYPRCAEDGFRAVLAGDPPSNRAWGAVLGLNGVMAAEGRYAELEALIDSAASAISAGARLLYVTDALAGAPFASQADALDGLVKSIYGDSYDGAQSATLFVLGTWHASRGSEGRITQVRNIRSALQAEADDGGSQELAQVLLAHERLAMKDSLGAMETLEARLPVAPYQELVWGLAAPLAFPLLARARIELAQRRFEEALATASLFDHPQPVVYLPYLPESLSIRIDAARALGRESLAAGFERRLRSLRGGPGA